MEGTWMQMEFKELTLEELIRGYIVSPEEGTCTCIFCGEKYEDGLIYHSRGRMVTAQRAIREHLMDIHDGVFHGLIQLDKQVSGLSDAQKEILEGMYLEKDNKEMGEEMGISVATVRTHKFNIQKMKREARILLAVMEQIENEEVVAERKQLEPQVAMASAPAVIEPPQMERPVTGNNLHPFFTQFNLK